MALHNTDSMFIKLSNKIYKNWFAIKMTLREIKSVFPRNNSSNYLMINLSANQDLSSITETADFKDRRP